MSSIIRKLIAGGPGRRTRFHTERNEIIPLAEFRHVPQCLMNYVLIKIMRRRPSKLWWPVNVIPQFEQLLDHSKSVLEFGSGSSTIWLARRSGHVFSFEDNEAWYEITKNVIERNRINNITLINAVGKDYFFPTSLVNEQFDLAIIDGSYRWKCAEFALPRIGKGGVVYLDNSDADKDRRFYRDPTDHHLAQSILTEFASTSSGVTLSRYRSMIHGELHAGEGMFLNFPQ